MLDEIDIKILQEFDKLKDKEVSTWYIMKKIFPRGMDKQNQLIKSRMIKMEKIGLFLITKNSPKNFSMISENVIFKNFKFPRRKEESPSLWVNINNYWECFELPDISYQPKM